MRSDSISSPKSSMRSGSSAANGIDVEDLAAQADLAGLLGERLARVAGCDQALEQALGVELLVRRSARASSRSRSSGVGTGCSSESSDATTSRGRRSARTGEAAARPAVAGARVSGSACALPARDSSRAGSHDRARAERREIVDEDSRLGFGRGDREPRTWARCRERGEHERLRRAPQVAAAIGAALPLAASRRALEVGERAELARSEDAPFARRVAGRPRSRAGLRVASSTSSASCAAQLSASLRVRPHALGIAFARPPRPRRGTRARAPRRGSRGRRTIGSAPIALTQLLHDAAWDSGLAVALRAPASQRLAQRREHERARRLETRRRGTPRPGLPRTGWRAPSAAARAGASPGPTRASRSSPSSARRLGQRLARHDPGLELGQVALGQVAVVVEELLGHHEVERRVTQELEPLVVRAEPGGAWVSASSSSVASRNAWGRLVHRASDSAKDPASSAARYRTDAPRAPTADEAVLGRVRMSTECTLARRLPARPMSTKRSSIAARPRVRVSVRSAPRRPRPRGARAAKCLGLARPERRGQDDDRSASWHVLAPTSGTVRVLGLDPTRDAPAIRARIGVVPQEIALYDHAHGAREPDVLRPLYGLEGERLARRVSGRSTHAGLADRADDRVKTYSGGMKRRLNIVAALLHEPELVFLDEPTVGIDPQSRNHVYEMVEALRTRGTTIVYTTHQLGEVERLCDRIVILDRGRRSHRARWPICGGIRARAPRPGATRIDAAHGGRRCSRCSQSAASPARVEEKAPDLEEIFLD